MPQFQPTCIYLKGYSWERERDHGFDWLQEASFVSKVKTQLHFLYFVCTPLYRPHPYVYIYVYVYTQTEVLYNVKDFLFDDGLLQAQLNVGLVGKGGVGEGKGKRVMRDWL